MMEKLRACSARTPSSKCGCATFKRSGTWRRLRSVAAAVAQLRKSRPKVTWIPPTQATISPWFVSFRSLNTRTQQGRRASLTKGASCFAQAVMGRVKSPVPQSTLIPMSFPLSPVYA
jgi:hypothetical protein